MLQCRFTVADRFVKDCYIVHIQLQWDLKRIVTVYNTYTVAARFVKKNGRLWELYCYRETYTAAERFVKIWVNKQAHDIDFDTAEDATPTQEMKQTQKPRQPLTMLVQPHSISRPVGHEEQSISKKWSNWNLRELSAEEGVYIFESMKIA